MLTSKTKERSDLSQGVHDIDQALTFDKHPGLLVHDSRGYEAKGYQTRDNEELELIRKFLRKRASKRDPKERLHAIWSVDLAMTAQSSMLTTHRFCIESDTSRIEEADLSIFQIVARYSADVPLFIVGTKKDKSFNNYLAPLMLDHRSELGDSSVFESLESQARSKALEDNLKLKQKLKGVEHYRSDGFCFLSKGTPKFRLAINH